MSRQARIGRTIATPGWTRRAAGSLVLSLGLGGAAWGQRAAPAGGGPSSPTEAGEASPSSQEMVEAMTAMARMCQAMMEREMAAMQYVAVGLGVLGVLLAIALILFIVLEVQWIRFFGVRIRVERQKLG